MQGWLKLKFAWAWDPYLQKGFDLPAWAMIGIVAAIPDPARPQEETADRLRAGLGSAFIAGAARQVARRDRVRRRLALFLAPFAAIVLLPYAIAPFYRFIDPVSTPMLWRRLTGQRVEQTFVPLSRVAPALPLTVIVAEDGSFCRNRGIDLGAMREALEQSDDNPGESRGASTITQQAAKNLFLWQGRSFVRKGAGNPAGALAQSGPAKAAGPGNLSQYRRMGPERRIRRRGRRALGLRQIGPRSRRPRGGELAAILPNPMLRSARTPGFIVRRLAGLYERRAGAYGALDACVRGPAQSPG